MFFFIGAYTFSLVPWPNSLLSVLSLARRTSCRMRNLQVNILKVIFIRNAEMVKVSYMQSQIARRTCCLYVPIVLIIVLNSLSIYWNYQVWASPYSGLRGPSAPGCRSCLWRPSLRHLRRTPIHIQRKRWMNNLFQPCRNMKKYHPAIARLSLYLF